MKLKKDPRQSAGTQNTSFAFAKENYIWMCIGLVLLGFGYLLLVGGGSDDPQVFNPEIFSTRRLTIAPLFMVAGLIVEVYAIMKRPSSKSSK